MKNSIKKITTLLLLLGISSSSFAVERYVIKGDVECYDGDTCYAEMEDKNITKNIRFPFRVRNIDAPERGQPFSKESTMLLQGVLNLPHNANILVCDGMSYKRKLCYVYQVTDSENDKVDITDIGKIMVSSGHAWDATKYSQGYYSLYQDMAKISKSGLWGLEENPTAPWEYRANKKNNNGNK